jgi:hypothetical protein
MKLLTSAKRAKLLNNGRRQAAVKGTPAEIDFFPVVKLFDPCGAATWLLTEIDPGDETVAWGLCDLGMGFPEFGTVSLPKDASKVRQWTAFIQDVATKPGTLFEVIDALAGFLMPQAEAARRLKGD